jgi:enoyl-CoA hydratase
MTTTENADTTATIEDHGREATVLYRREGRVGVVTLNRPEKLNAIDVETHVLLDETLRRADRDVETRVTVLTGAGRGFCAGGDTSRMQGDFQEEGRHAVHSPGRHLIHTLTNAEKPLIAMVNGPAAGLGATLALYCDIVVMADDARIGDRHVNVGLVAGDGGAVIWPLLVGVARAKEFLLTGRLIDGKEAARIGLVSRSVPLADLSKTVMELAREIAALPPYAVRASKVSVNKIVAAANDLVLDTSLALEHLSMRTADHREAVLARHERRDGVYTGR